MPKYTGAKTKEISFPLGGIGTGSIGLGGNGRLMDWEILNRPAKGSLNYYSHIAVRAKSHDGKVFPKVLNGDLQKDIMGQYSKLRFDGYGYGASGQTMAGFPHFENCEFDGEFPFASLTFNDKEFPGQVTLSAFNPFIPLDSLNSSLPAAFFQVNFSNPTDEPLVYQAAFSLANPFLQGQNNNISTKNLSAVHLTSPKPVDDIEYGDLTIACDSPDCTVQEYWYRGEWMDKIVTFWREFSSGHALKPRSYDTPCDEADTCTLLASVTLAPGETKDVRFVLAWNKPNCHNYWRPYKDENDKDITWKNYYATMFESSAKTAEYCLESWQTLYNKTRAFKDALYSSTLDPAVIEAAASNLSILKSPTVLRLQDGTLYGWEGVHELEGSCEGTCCHVWNYAYALCFLFPDLERSIRESKFKYSLDEAGAMCFRMPLPLGRRTTGYRACLDGQMGTIIKVYREWKLSGDTGWLKSQWPDVKKALEFAWSPENKDRWDANKDGVLEGRQHHTLDMELFGPAAWLQGFYLGALKSAAEMAQFLGEHEKHAEYIEIFDKGYAWTKQNLFNGEYFTHEIDLNDVKIPESFGAMSYWNAEAGEIKYQIGDGCSIDQLCAQWHANICGIGDLFDKSQRKTALENMYKNNFKTTMRNFTNPWRLFSLNDESGAVICDYPAGSRKPAIPIPYCEETMHGFEYQLAGLLISEGFVDEGLSIVRSVRERYDGEKRNPWNEYECGSNYARSMASFALYPIFSGFFFDLPNKKIGFNPVVSTENFRSFWAVGSAWGVVHITDRAVKIEIKQGSLDLSEITLPFAKSVAALAIDGKATGFEHSDGNVKFPQTKINSSIEITL